eukprot:8839230-Pyramimonas_sp.AAC.1
MLRDLQPTCTQQSSAQRRILLILRAGRALVAGRPVRTQIESCWSGLCSRRAMEAGSRAPPWRGRGGGGGGQKTPNHTTQNHSHAGGQPFPAGTQPPSRTLAMHRWGPEKDGAPRTGQGSSTELGSGQEGGVQEGGCESGPAA